MPGRPPPAPSGSLTCTFNVWTSPVDSRMTSMLTYRSPTSYVPALGRTIPSGLAKATAVSGVGGEITRPAVSLCHWTSVNVETVTRMPNRTTKIGSVVSRRRPRLQPTACCGCSR